MNRKIAISVAAVAAAALIALMIIMIKPPEDETSLPAVNESNQPELPIAADPDPTPTQLSYYIADRDPVIYEAEDAELVGTKKAKSGSGYSGSGFVTDFDQEGDRVVFHMDVPVKGIYDLTIGYRAPHGDKQFNLLLNGKPMGDVAINETDQFLEISGGKMLMDEGINEVAVTRGWGWYDIDYIKLQPSPAPGPHQLDRRLSNPNAAPEARRLLDFLADQYGQSILSGQQGFSNISWIERKTGKRPAIIGFDLIDYSPSRVEFGAKSTETEKAIFWHNMGGIVTFAWHWNAPTDLINEPGKEWYRGFYTDSTNFDIEYAMNNPDSEQYALIVRDIDAIAEQLTVLKDKGIPVLFRPLHEAEGGWFWWGAKGPEPCKALYRLLYDKLTNEHQLNNLIWVWNSVAPEWYPGDDVVDIVSYDSYPPEGDYGPVTKPYDSLVQLTGDRKIAAMSENGAIPDPDLLQLYRTDWSWFCTWEGNFLIDGKTNELEHLIKVYNHDYVLTLDELPDLF